MNVSLNFVQCQNESKIRHIKIHNLVIIKIQFVQFLLELNKISFRNEPL